MNDPTPVKKGLTLAWSIGIGVVFLGITSVVLMPATKSARSVMKAQPAFPSPTPTPTPTASTSPSPTPTP